MHRHGDSAGSEIVGTIVVIAVLATAIFAAGAAMQAPQPAPDAPPLGIVADAAPGSAFVQLTRTSGLDLDLGDLRVAVRLDGSTIFQGPAGASGTRWIMGETLALGPVGHTFAAGDDVEVSVVSLAGPYSSLLTEASVATGSVAPTTPPGTLTAASIAPPATSPPGLWPTDNFFASVQVDHADGRKLVLSVTGQLPELTEPIEMRDDGTDGDARAGDGLYSAHFEVPVNALPGAYPVVFTVTDMSGTRATNVSWIRVLAPALPTGPLNVSAPAAPPTPPTPPAAPPPPPAPPATPPFAILPKGGVSALKDENVTVRVIGSAITYGAGGPPVPVTTAWTQDGGKTLTPLFGNKPVVGGNAANFSVKAGAVMGIHGDAKYSTFHAAYNSFDANPHVVVLKDGDNAPNVAAFAGQTSIKAYLAPFVVGGKVKLGSTEVIVLFEFNPSLTSAAADFQDLVVLLDFHV